MMSKVLIAIVLFFAATAQALTIANPSSTKLGATSGGSTFLSSNVVVHIPEQTKRSSNIEMMGGKKAKFGIFSPAVYGAKFALGEKKLNSIRGKAISLHSQYIGEFCEWAGAYHLRTRLIKKAKTNGDTLGFLV